MAQAQLQHRAVYGVKASLKDVLTYVDEHTLLYPAGANLVLYNAEQKTQRFLSVIEKDEQLLNIAVSSNKKWLAVCKRTSEVGTATLYELETLKKKRTILVPDTAARDIVSASFSADAKYLVLLTGSPEWQLTFWQWDKNKLMAGTKVPNAINATISQTYINPQDASQVSMLASNMFRSFRYQDNQLKQTILNNRTESKVFLCHAWYNEELVLIGTETGKILVADASEIKAELDAVHLQEPFAVHCIYTNGKGFIAAGSSGAVVFYEATDGKEMFKRVKEFTAGSETRIIKSLAMNTTEDVVAVKLDNAQLLSISLNTSDSQKEQRQKFQTLLQPFHSGSILGLDVCIRKPILATCSTDKTVKIWNFADNTCEFEKLFSEETYSVAIHPTGLYALVGFGDKLRLMNVLMDDLRVLKEFNVRGCREARFSTGGQFFAAVHGTVIQIYNTWTFENVINLKGHSGKIKNLQWSDDDLHITSCGADGAVYLWSVQDGKRVNEAVSKGVSFTSAVVTDHLATMLAVGGDKSIKVMAEGQVKRQLDTDVTITQLCFSRSGKYLFAGTASGAIRCMKWPLSAENDGSTQALSTATGSASLLAPSTAVAGPSTNTDFVEYAAHDAPITRMLVSFDDQCLFSVSEDGCIYVMKIADKDGSSIKRPTGITYADEILVTREDLEERTNMIVDLKTRVEKLKLENEYQLRLRDMTFQEKIKEITDKYTAEIDGLKLATQNLHLLRQKKLEEHQERMRLQQEKSEAEFATLRKTHEGKLLAEYDKYAQLQQRALEIQKQWETNIASAELEREQVLKSLTESYQARIRQKQAEVEEVSSGIRKNEDEHGEVAQQVEEEAETEITELRLKYERKVKDEHEIALRLKGENGVMRKKFTALQADIEGHREKVLALFNEEKRLRGVIKGLEDDISGLKREISDREDTLQDKEKRMSDLKKKNQELEKFKFVLDHKIAELKKQVEPRERDIISMTAQIKTMDTTLDDYNNVNAKLELQISDLTLKLREAEKDLKAEKERVRHGANAIKRFRTDLNECVRNIGDPKLLKSSMRRLYHKYCKDNGGIEVSEPTASEEMDRQREYLASTVTSLQKRIDFEATLHRKENVKIMQENVILIREINQLRRDLKFLRQRESEETLKAGPRPDASAQSSTLLCRLLSQ